MPDQPQSQALAPVKAPELPPAPNSTEAALALLGGGVRPFYSSFDPTSAEGKKLLWDLNEGADCQVLESVGQTIDLRHVYAADAEKVDPKTGEVKELVRLVLVAKDGTTYQCFSKGVRHSLKLLFAAEGLPPYTRPMLVTFGIKKIANGQLLTLRPADAAPAKKGGGK